MHHWKEVTPLHNRFIQAIIQSGIHLIVCTRRKTDYSITQESGKRAEVEKVGLKSEIREGFEYELDLVFGLNHSHLATVEKDRTAIYHDTPGFIITPETGEKLLKWAESAAKLSDKLVMFNRGDSRHAGRLKEKLCENGIDEKCLEELTGLLHGKDISLVDGVIEKFKTKTMEAANG